MTPIATIYFPSGTLMSEARQFIDARFGDLPTYWDTLYNAALVYPARKEANDE